MAFSSSLGITTLLFLLSLTLAPATCCYERIFSFGDSLADTGNAVLIADSEAVAFSARFPYGETYFRRPTGRFSDGRLVVDFVAEAMGLPFLPPFFGGAENGDGFRHGVNFAVGGATALDNEFFVEEGIPVASSNLSLRFQMEWFRLLLPSFCTSCSECRDILSKSLFLVGEIGGNDYNIPFLQGRDVDEIKTFVPKVVDAIGSAVTELIAMGAGTLVVPGNLPIGCGPIYLTNFQSKSRDDYDPHTGCIKWLNEFSEYHNLKLQEKLQRLRRLHPSATIIYADYYNAALSIYRSPNSFGIGVTLSACCGGGGPYNLNMSAFCGSNGSNLCDDPSKYVSWDGLHSTEAAYRAIADMLLNGTYAAPAINSTCPGAGSAL